MDSQKDADWVQIATGVALLVGLVLVVWELSQSRDVATAQLSSDGTDRYLQSAVPRMGENPAAALAKSNGNTRRRATYSKRAIRWLGQVASHQPELFVHWSLGAPFPAE